VPNRRLDPAAGRPKEEEMARKGPLVTLLGGGALAAVMLTASIIAATGGDDDPDPALAGGSPTPEVSPDVSPEPEESPEPEADPEPVTYVGYVDGGGASVAIIVTGDEAVAYLCDGATVEAWLNGSARDGVLDLSGDGGSLTGSYDSGQAAGQAATEGRYFDFTIEAVAPPEGLYRFADTVVGGAEVQGGWIVLPDGTQVGLLTVDGQTGPAPALDLDTGGDPGRVEVAGTAVTVERQG
jgi:hypothetical protein